MRRFLSLLFSGLFLSSLFPVIAMAGPGAFFGNTPAISPSGFGGGFNVRGFSGSGRGGLSNFNGGLSRRGGRHGRGGSFNQPFNSTSQSRYLNQRASTLRAIDPFNALQLDDQLLNNSGLNPGRSAFTPFLPGSGTNFIPFNSRGTRGFTPFTLNGRDVVPQSYNAPSVVSGGGASLATGGIGFSSNLPATGPSTFGGVTNTISGRVRSHNKLKPIHPQSGVIRPGNASGTQFFRIR